MIREDEDRQTSAFEWSSVLLFLHPGGGLCLSRLGCRYVVLFLGIGHNRIILNGVLLIINITLPYSVGWMEIMMIDAAMSETSFRRYA